MQSRDCGCGNLASAAGLCGLGFKGVSVPGCAGGARSSTSAAPSRMNKTSAAARRKTHQALEVYKQLHSSNGPAEGETYLLHWWPECNRGSREDILDQLRIASTPCCRGYRIPGVNRGVTIESCSAEGAGGSDLSCELLDEERTRLPLAQQEGARPEGAHPHIRRQQLAKPILQAGEIQVRSDSNASKTTERSCSPPVACQPVLPQSGAGSQKKNEQQHGREHDECSVARSVPALQAPCAAERCYKGPLLQGIRHKLCRMRFSSLPCQQILGTDHNYWQCLGTIEQLRHADHHPVSCRITVSSFSNVSGSPLCGSDAPAHYLWAWPSIVPGSTPGDAHAIVIDEVLRKTYVCGRLCLRNSVGDIDGLQQVRQCTSRHATAAAAAASDTAAAAAAQQDLGGARSQPAHISVSLHLSPMAKTAATLTSAAAFVDVLIHLFRRQLADSAQRLSSVGGHPGVRHHVAQRDALSRILSGQQTIKLRMCVRAGMSLSRMLPCFP